MAIDGPAEGDLVEWVSAMTYQAASGRRSAEHARAAAADGRGCTSPPKGCWTTRPPRSSSIDREVAGSCATKAFPPSTSGCPLAGSLLPWIDTDLGNGQSREEWKGHAETNKILGRPEGKQIPVDGLCVRVGAMRCHSQGLTIKLKRDLPLAEIEGILASANDWVEVVPNRREEPSSA
jgi:aspartate-semialdehyde dehydrogenase